MTDTIEERLRYATRDPETGQRLDSGVYGHAPIEDLEEAAYEIDRLEQENKRLRDALDEISNEWDDHSGAVKMIDIARRTLEGGER